MACDGNNPFALSVASTASEVETPVALRLCVVGATLRANALLGCALGVLLLAASSFVRAATVPVHFGLFGNVHVATPAGEPKRAIVLISDAKGWDARTEALASAQADAGAFVLGIDLPAYLAQMESIDAKCSFPAGHFEEMIHWIQRDRKLDKYIYPILVGDGAGATFAYVLDAQAPQGTYTALVTLGWDADFRLPKPVCKGDAGAMTAPDGKGGFRVVPVKSLPNPWLPQPFMPGARHVGVLNRLPAFAKRRFAAAHADNPDPGKALAAAIDWLTAPARAIPPLPQDIADLPLETVPAQGAFAQRIGIILTGDGGWAGLDVAVANQLAQRGIDVVALNTLKYFWETRTPDQAADALTRIIGHYGAQYPLADFIVLGYSFGAGLSPVLINRLPESARKRVAAQVLISPDDTAVFEIHVGDWFGSTAHKGAIPIAPEIAKTQVPVICVHGADEDDSFCKQIVGKPNVRELVLPGAHHYNGDYDTLGAAIVAALPAHRN
ncbi:MAG: virulence factor family protein [Xanthomonadales bacterium PRO7]|jgi:type IV secretory pathway VirJ component|nr:virulence factor family protein [Xanthomonadales bacterium PRO7]